MDFLKVNEGNPKLLWGVMGFGRKVVRGQFCPHAQHW